MSKIDFKKLLPYIVAIAIFVILTLIYCAPMLKGKVMAQSDTLQWQGMSNEVRTFAKETGHKSFWTNSMFGGMPTYQIASTTNSQSVLNAIKKVYTLFLSSTMANLIVYFFGFFILMLACRINKWLSIIGSIAITFSSYFFIIIAAGHVTKALTIGYMAAVIAGFIFIFRGRYLLGACLTMLFTAFGMILHPQMAYYFMLMIGIFSCAELYIHLKNNNIKTLLAKVGIFAASLLIGLGTGYSNIKSNADYVKETMRSGHTELQTEANGKQMKGLSYEYATSWSYGVSETMTLMIPNFNGGSSHYNVGDKSDLYKEMVRQNVPARNAKQFCQSLPMYWGAQPFTEGPVYVGAIICFLFILGLFIVEGPRKWALFAATLFSIMLAWGQNFDALTRLFFNYFPLYNKFRAVSSILVVAEVAMPLLGIMTIQQIIDDKIEKQKLIKSIGISGGITGGICLLIALFGGSMFSFTTAGDAQIFQQLPDWLNKLIISERANMMRSDAFRSLVFIILSVSVIWLYINKKVKFGIFTTLLGALIIFDMWQIDKRFFNDNNFVNKKESTNYFTKLPYEEAILKDTDPNFRVLNLTTNTFNDARTSYYLKSIGGYHAAKLRRYQDLIDQHISRGNMEVLNMLNTKYIIQRNDQGAVPQLNPSALGNCWFADSLVVAATPREECDALNYINTANTIVTDAKFENLTKNFNSAHDSSANIKLTKYTPDELEYTSTTSTEKTAVFSEIYYPYGWNAYIDGNKAEIFRVNYVLRALNIPSGQHQIKFEFRPDSIYKGDKISMAFIIIMLCFIVGSICFSGYKAIKTYSACKN